VLIKKNILTPAVTSNIFIFVRSIEKPVIPLAPKQLI
jgi:hypothetical protein